MRIPISSRQSAAVVNAGNSVVGIIIMNSSPTDVFVDTDQRLLDTVDSFNLPQNGVRFPTGMPAPVAIPFFTGILYARAQTDTVLDLIPFAISPIGVNPICLNG